MLRRQDIKIGEMYFINAYGNQHMGFATLSNIESNIGEFDTIFLITGSENKIKMKFERVYTIKRFLRVNHKNLWHLFDRLFK